ncbi:uncharacterized protein LOC131934814 [Physella acuta]|uniref:uncharacterized protein LOC131934814 n=1 Tax=Physella acuta TaxID=109671 RepID=UPI0027DE059C|nr:uncharacterized protein LOC131934814 [Physella acuta]
MARTDKDLYSEVWCEIVMHALVNQIPVEYHALYRLHLIGVSDLIVSSPYELLEEGKNATITCTLWSAQLSAPNYPLAWSRVNGLPNGSIIHNYPFYSATKTYRTELTFVPVGSDNDVPISCTASDGFSTNTEFFTVSVILAPYTPNITGNLTVRAGVTDSWTCVVDGASHFPPGVYWRNADGLSLTQGVSKNTKIYLKNNNNYVYKVTSVYTAALPAQDPYVLTCYVVHQMDSYYNIMKQTSITIHVISVSDPIVSSPYALLEEGKNATITCTLSSAQLSAPNYPLVWSRVNGLPNGSAIQNYPFDSATKTYRSELTFVPGGSDNDVPISCTASDGFSTKTRSTTVSVILAPYTPNITGNLTVRAGVTDSWTCVVDGGSYIPPTVYWSNGDGLSLTQGVSKITNIIVKNNNNYVYKVTSVYTAALPAQDPYVLTCYVVHQMDSYYNIMKQSSITIHVISNKSTSNVVPDKKEVNSQNDYSFLYYVLPIVAVVIVCAVALGVCFRKAYLKQELIKRSEKISTTPNNERITSQPMDSDGYLAPNNEDVGYTVVRHHSGDCIQTGASNQTSVYDLYNMEEENYYCTIKDLDEIKKNAFSERKHHNTNEHEENPTTAVNVSEYSECESNTNIQLNIERQRNMNRVGQQETTLDGNIDTNSNRKLDTNIDGGNLDIISDVQLGIASTENLEIMFDEKPQNAPKIQLDTSNLTEYLEPASSSERKLANNFHDKSSKFNCVQHYETESLQNEPGTIANLTEYLVPVILETTLGYNLDKTLDKKTNTDNDSVQPHEINDYLNLYDTTEDTSNLTEYLSPAIFSEKKN